MQTKPTSHHKALADTDQSYAFVVKNSFIRENKVDPFIKITRNSLGLRGKEYDPKIHQKKILFVGGSTTECITLSDGTTWIDHLEESLSLENMWFGNAGVNGQSTFGHLEFMKRFFLGLKPDVMVFFIGANEINRFYLDQEDKTLVDFGKKRERDFNAIKSEKKIETSQSIYQSLWYFIHTNKDSSALLYTISELRNRHLTKNFYHNYIHNLNLEELKTVAPTNYEFEVELTSLDSSSPRLQRLKSELMKQKDFRKRIKENIKELIAMSRKNGITPLLMTQPALYGKGIDPQTGVNLETMILQSGNTQVGQGLTGYEMWRLLESYNDITREVAKQENVPFIDLAVLMPKNSRYYYDYIHFSKEGAEKMAEIIQKPFKLFIKSTFQK